ncbi:flavin-containing monooxygenase [Sandarakinorhabdus oryzae]|uniref:flavin-containing monooxygenase n=1 Tax=Sandarakinorhabdus oryzae TaxID=2675220 RepID=UPI0012E138B4|nr:NAD(P)/FAD-dependent oxidoreductase [Sandarakinorhabdus oryzae]
MAERLDVLIVGAGFSGMYMLVKCRELGLKSHVFEAGSGVGGTWYWNRYPGARVDIQSLDYCYGFDEQLEKEWRWSERYAPQPELLAYANHVADRYDLKKDISFNTRVTAADWDAGADGWNVTLDTGEVIAARFVVLATGCLSVPTDVTFPGIEDYKGTIYRTSRWPHDGVDFSGQRVGIIGTGSSAIQSIPIIAESAGHLTVFQRTPNFSMPAHNGPIPEEDFQEWLKDPRAFRARSRYTAGGFWNDPRDEAIAIHTPPQEIKAELERRWAWGGFRILNAFADQAIDPAANKIISDFVAAKIREQVKDPKVAELLTPKDHPFGTKRPCVDTGYYATYNRDNVSLVDLRADPLETFTATGIKTKHNSFDFDAVVLATGFDAMTGAIERIAIRGRTGETIQEHWAHGPETYLGLMVAGFPNMFLITGPGSPSVLTNMINSIEQHVDYVTEIIASLNGRQAGRIEATREAEQTWTDLVDQSAAMTLFPQANSWYMGANVPGKPRRFLAFTGGLHIYSDICNAVRDKGWEGFTIARGDQVLHDSHEFTSLPPPPDNMAPHLMEMAMGRVAKWMQDHGRV